MSFLNTLFNTPTKYAAALAGIGIIFLGLAGNALHTGKFKQRGEEIIRDESPVIFYFLVLFILGIALICFVSALLVWKGRIIGAVAD